MAVKKKWKLAEKADRFDLYQRSVQHADHEIEFFEQAFRDEYGRNPTSLREDFCGTFAVCCEWVKTGRDRYAIGVDLCEETLQWGRENNLAELTRSQQKRVKILAQDVRTNGDEALTVNTSSLLEVALRPV